MEALNERQAVHRELQEARTTVDLAHRAMPILPVATLPGVLEGGSVAVTRVELGEVREELDGALQREVKAKVGAWELT